MPTRSSARLCQVSRAFFCSLALLPLGLAASTELPAPLSERLDRAAAVLVGDILSTSTETGPEGVYTVALVRPVEALKGRLPDALPVRFPGGVLDESRAVVAGGFPLPQPGERYVLMLDADAAGRPVAGTASGIVRWPKENGPEAAPRSAVAPTIPPGWGLAPGDRADAVVTSARAWLEAHPEVAAAGADWSDRGAPAPSVAQSAPGFVLASGRGARLAQADRGPIPYRIDFQALPSGISVERARQAVETALAVWSAVAAVEFVPDGEGNFNMPASLMSTTVPTLFIQLHDLFGAIGGGTTLGIGGRTFITYGSSDGAALATGGRGGRVNGYDFNLTVAGYVTMAHSRSFFTNNPANFEEVLLHEIGHALGLGHSSESDAEANPYLRGAIMYYTAEGNNRGAVPGQYDIDVIRNGYPVDVRVPGTWTRNLRIVSRSTGGQPAGVNRWFLPAIDPAGLPLTWIGAGNASPGFGTFSIEGNEVLLAASGAFNVFPLAPDGDAAYARYFVFADNGVHRSAPIDLRVIAIDIDDNNDGLPDRWMQDNFGAVSPIVGLSRPQDDPDGDGYSNLREMRAGTDPRDAGSPRSQVAITGQTLTFTAVPLEVYAIEAAETPQGPWSLVTYVQPVTENGSWTAPASAEARRFYRVRHVD